MNSHFLPRVCLHVPPYQPFDECSSGMSQDILEFLCTVYYPLPNVMLFRAVPEFNSLFCKCYIFFIQHGAYAKICGLAFLVRTQSRVLAAFLWSRGREFHVVGCTFSFACAFAKKANAPLVDAWAAAVEVDQGKDANVAAMNVAHTCPSSDAAKCSWTHRFIPHCHGPLRHVQQLGVWPLELGSGG